MINDCETSLEVSKLNYEALAAHCLAATHPREKRHPPTELERYEHVKDGTIRFLFEHDCVATPAQLIDFFGFSHARLTKILGDLEADGLVLRQNDRADRRRVIVHLTDKGLEYAVQKHNDMLKRMTALLQALGEEDAQHFVRIIGRLSELNMHPGDF